MTSPAIQQQQPLQRRVHEPLMQWDPVAVVHTATAAAVLALGGALMLARKGTPAHRLMGRAWAASMATTCVSSFGLRDLQGDLSWIHGLSTFTLASVAAGVVAVRRKNVVLHKRCMLGAYAGAAGAGVFAVFTPGRRIYNELFGAPA